MWISVSFEDVRFLLVWNHSCLPVCVEEKEKLIASYGLSRNNYSTIASLIGYHRVTTVGVHIVIQYIHFMAFTFYC